MNMHKLCYYDFSTIILRLITKLLTFYTLLDYGVPGKVWERVPTTAHEGPSQKFITISLRFDYEQAAASFRESGPRNRSQQNGLAQLQVKILQLAEIIAET